MKSVFFFKPLLSISLFRLEKKRDLELFASWGNLNTFQLDENEGVQKGMKKVKDKIFSSVATSNQSKLLLTSFINKFLEEMEKGLSLTEFKVKMDKFDPFFGETGNQRKNLKHL